ncbi:MAG: hypothetical protein IKR39_01350 [Lachnospiraceae bacterium]|nr:hypothetical protein [Lachnospiraceae bacterium]
MKKTILKIIASILTFAGTLFLAGFLMNRGNVNTTRDMERATLPVISMSIGGETINELHGYTSEMDLGLLRENITPLDDQRGVTFRVTKHGRVVDKITAKVRTVDGSRLIESSEITDYTEDDYTIHAGIRFKDLLKEYTEYSLQIYLTFSDNTEAFYHTRIIKAPSYCVKEKIAFIKDFCTNEMTLDSAKSLKTYMESNSSGDNTTLAKVNIHSSLEQLSFGNLNVRRETEPVMNIKEIAKETAVFTVNYLIKASNASEETEYFVEECFRIRYTGEVMYLLDFERTMGRVIYIDTPIIRGEDILLGITNDDKGLIESDDGNVIAFCNENVLYSYNADGNRLVKLFSFYDESNFDERTYNNNHAIKALSVDEAGNVWFAVYGYMNRGTYEGRVGVTLYMFNGVTNEVEEAFFIASDKSADIVMRDLEELCFLNREGIFYLMLDKSIYAIDVENKTTEILVENLEEDKYTVSSNSTMMVWQEGADVNASSSLKLMNLHTKQISTIEAPNDQYIKPIAFMGEDFAYGLAYKSDIVEDNTGRITFPMYCVKIQSKFGENLKQYKEDGAYVTGGTVKDNLLTLTRVKKSDKETLSYIAIDNEYITNNQKKEDLQNKIDIYNYSDYEKVVRIILKKDAKAKVVKIVPREVIYEGTRELEMKRAASTHDYYYVYYKGRLQKIYTNPANAVQEANLNYATVLNGSGRYVWYRANRNQRNQIMDLSVNPVGEENRSPLAFCLDKMLEYEGVVRNSEYMLARGNSVLSILRGSLENAEVLDLSGCSLDSILYYVNRDIPVLGIVGDDAYLVIGFNQIAVVVLDSKKGWYKLGMNEAEKLFAGTGNRFITYVPLKQE